MIWPSQHRFCHIVYFFWCDSSFDSEHAFEISCCTYGLYSVLLAYREEVSLYVVHIYDSSRIHLDTEIASTKHCQGEFFCPKNLLDTINCIRCFKFSAQCTRVAIGIHDFDEMLDVSGSTKVGNHDIVDKIKSEHITSEFHTFMVVLSHAVYPEWSISDTDSFASFEYILGFSGLYFCAFERGSSLGFSSDSGCHFPIIKYDAVSDLHDGYNLRKANPEMIVRTKSFY